MLETCPRFRLRKNSRAPIISGLSILCEKFEHPSDKRLCDDQPR